MSEHQASEQVALGCGAVWLLIRRTRCSLLYCSTLKTEARSSAEAELPKTLLLAFTVTRLYECWVQAIGCWLLAEELQLVNGVVLQSDID
jgi:hypothetical protein